MTSWPQREWHSHACAAVEAGGRGLYAYLTEETLHGRNVARVRFAAATIPGKLAVTSGAILSLCVGSA